MCGPLVRSAKAWSRALWPASELQLDGGFLWARRPSGLGAWQGEMGSLAVRVCQVVCPAGGWVRFLTEGQWLRAWAPSCCQPRGVLSLPSSCPSEKTGQVLPLLFRRPWGSLGSAGAPTVCGVAGGVGAEPLAPSTLARPCVCRDSRLLCPCVREGALVFGPWW